MPRKPKRKKRQSPPIDPLDVLCFFAGMMGAKVLAAHWESTRIDPATRAPADALFAKLGIPTEID